MSHHLIDIIRECVTGTQKLVDEVYLQLVKQLRGNKRPVQVVRLCQVMCVIIYHVLPTSYLCMAILNILMTLEALTKNAEEN